MFTEELKHGINDRYRDDDSVAIYYYKQRNNTVTQITYFCKYILPCIYAKQQYSSIYNKLNNIICISIFDYFKVFDFSKQIAVCTYHTESQCKQPSYQIKVQRFKKPAEHKCNNK